MRVQIELHGHPDLPNTIADGCKQEAQGGFCPSAMATRAAQNRCCTHRFYCEVGAGYQTRNGFLFAGMNMREGRGGVKRKVALWKTVKQVETSD